MVRAPKRGKENDVKSIIKKTLLGVSLAALVFTSLAGCIVYDPDPYPRSSYQERYSYRPYYYSRPYYYRYYGHSHWNYRD